VQIRLASLTATPKTETFDVDQIDMETGVITTTQESRTETIYEEIPLSVLTGSMTISAISSSGITFDYVLYDVEKKAFEKFNIILPLGSTFDFNSDGLVDLVFRTFNPGSRTGFDNCYEVAFLSDKESSPPTPRCIRFLTILPFHFPPVL